MYLAALFPTLARVMEAASLRKGFGGEVSNLFEWDFNVFQKPFATCSHVWMVSSLVTTEVCKSTSKRWGRSPCIGTTARGFTSGALEKGILVKKTPNTSYILFGCRGVGSWELKEHETLWRMRSSNKNELVWLQPNWQFSAKLAFWNIPQ